MNSELYLNGAPLQLRGMNRHDDVFLLGGNWGGHVPAEHALGPARASRMWRAAARRASRGRVVRGYRARAAAALRRPAHQGQRPACRGQ